MPSECIQALSPGIFIVNSPESIYSPKDTRPGLKQQFGPGIGLVMSKSHNSNDDQVGGRKNTLQENGRELTFGGLEVEGDVGKLLDEGRDVMMPATEVLLDGVAQLNSQLMQDMIAGETNSPPEDCSRVSSPGGIISPSSIHPESYFHGSDTGFHDNTTQMSLGEKYAGLKLEDSSCLTSIDSMWSAVADSGDDGEQAVSSRKLMKSTLESDTSTSLSMQNAGEDEEVFDAAGAANSSQFVFTKFGSDVPGIFTFGVNQASISTSTCDAISRPLSSTTTVETTCKSAPATSVSPRATTTPLPAEPEEVVSAPPVKRMKEPSLNVSFPAKAGGYELRVVVQPEEQHRARYMTEGSRGSIKDRSQQNHPVVKLLGYNGTESVKLLVFIGTDTGKVKPHGFYQACRVCGKTSSNCDQQDIEGTTVIDYMLQPTEEMTACIDGVGILKLRNADVEQRIGIARSKKKSTRTRLVFRVNIPKPDGSFLTLQVASSPISCTQPAGQPEICKKSLSEASVEGGQELFIIGKNFTKGTKVIFQERKDKIVWTAEAPIDNDYFQQSHLICIVPEYKAQDVEESVNVEVVICCSGRSSDPSPFIYHGVRKEDTVVKVQDVPIPMETEPSPMKSAVAPEALEWNKMFEKVSKVGSSQQPGSPSPTASFVSALLQQEKERELKKEVDDVTPDLGLSMDNMCCVPVPQQTLHSIVKTDMGNMIEITNKLGSPVHNHIPVDICHISNTENPLAQSLQTENYQIQNTPDIKSVLSDSPSIQPTETVNTTLAPTLQSPVVPEMCTSPINIHMAESAKSQGQNCGSLDVSSERIVILTDGIAPSEPAVHEKKNTLDGQLNLNNLTLTPEQKGVLVDLLQTLVEQKRSLSTTERKPDGQFQQKRLLRDQQNERQEQLLKDECQQYLQIDLRNESQMVDHAQEKQQTIQFHLQDHQQQQQQLKQEQQVIERQHMIQQQMKQEQEDIQQQLQQQQQHQAVKQQLEEQQQQNQQHQQMMQHEQILQIQQDDQQNQQRQQDLQLQQQQQQQQQQEFMKEQQLKQQQEMQQKQQELHRELQRQEHQEQQKQLLQQQQQQVEQQHMKMQQQLQDQRNQQRLQEQLKQQQLKEFQQQLRKQHQLNEQQFHLQQESSPGQEQQSVNTNQTEQIQLQSQQLAEHQQCPITTSNTVAMQNASQQGPQHILIIDTVPNQQHLDKDQSNQQCVNEQKTPLAISSPIQQQQAHHVLIQGGQIPRVQAVVNQLDSANQRKPQLHVKCQTRNEGNSALRTTMTNQVIRQPQPILPKPPVATFLQPQVICSIIEQPSKGITDQTIVSSSHQESSAVIADISMSKNGFGSNSSELATLLLHTSSSQVVTSDSRQRPIMVTVTQPHLQDVNKSQNVQTNMTSTAAVIHIPTSGFQLDPRSQANTQPTAILSQVDRLLNPTAANR